MAATWRRTRIVGRHGCGHGTPQEGPLIPHRSNIRVQTLRGSEGWDLTDSADGLSFSNTNPGGDERASFNLKREWFAGAPEIGQGATLRISDGLDVLFQGTIDENDRAVANSEQIGVTAYGKGVLLKDDESFRQVIVDQDPGSWGDMPLNRKVTFLDAGGGFSLGDFSWVADGGALVCALPNQPLGAQAVGEAWYIAPSGVTIAKVMYAGVESLPVGYENALLLNASADNGTTGVASITMTLDGTLRTVTPATPRRYTYVRIHSNGTAATPAGGNNRRFSKIAAYANHGITLRDPGDGNPYGVWGSDAVAYLVALVSGITARRIDASSYVIPQLAWKQGVTHHQAVEDSSRFDSVNWGVWGPDSALDTSTGGYFDWTAKQPDVQHWYCLRSQCDDVSLNVEMATLYEAVDVVYTDASGIEQVERRTQTVPLLDEAARNRVATYPGGTLTQAGAQKLGDAFLSLAGTVSPARGQVVLVQSPTHHRRGTLSPVHMRADGANLRVPDVLPSSELFSLSAAPDRRTTFP